MHIAAGPEYPERIIKAEQRPQQVLFSPKPMVVHNPFFRIFEWEKDVMYVHENTCSQAGYDLEVLVIDIISDAKHVARVDKQNIALGEVPKQRIIDLFQRFRDQLRHTRYAREQDLIGVRFDAQKVSRETLLEILPARSSGH